MCGIAGEIRSRADECGAEAFVAMANRSQFRRGPDAGNTEVIQNGDALVVLGSRRLSVVDPRPLSDQPLWSEGRRFCITYNGEIFNYLELRADLEARGHTFKTTGDTEVLLVGYQEWGTDLLPRLNGMFAFAILDVAKNEVLLARDRFGVKPLYWGNFDGRFRFASTPAALAQDRRLQPDLAYVARGVRFGVYDMGTTSPYQGIKAVAPGFWIAVSTKTGFARRSGQYYDLRTAVAGRSQTLAERDSKSWAEELLDLLDSAVDLRFRADAPVAISLSGGLDSGSIAACARHRQGRGVVGFSFGDPEDPRSEGPLVRGLAEALGIQVEFVQPSPTELQAAFDATLRAQGAPFKGLSVVAQYLVFAAMRARGYKVALGGQGGDEALQGYSKFMLLRVREALRSGQPWQGLTLACYCARRLLATNGPRQLWSQIQRNTSPLGNQSLKLSWPNVALPAPLGRAVTAAERQFLEYEFASLPTLLRYEDRNSMGNSVESRLPFMDVRLVEYCLALPGAAKIRRGYGKWALRQAMAGLIPEAIRLNRMKRGFETPQADWIRTGLGKLVRARLQEAKPGLASMTLPPGNIPNVFSDEELCRTPTVLAEAIGAIWLGNTAGSSRLCACGNNESALACSNH